MRTPAILFILPILLARCVPAEVIYLKNGRKIWADQVRQTDTRVEYDIGDNSYGIPKSVVDRVEAGGIQPDADRSSADPEVPAFAPTDSLRNEPELSSKIIREGKVDTDALDSLEGEGNAGATATGYFLAGKHEFEHQNFSKAVTYFDAALRFDPQNATILNYYAAVLVRTGNATEALPYAERAVRITPNSPDSLDVLGYAQFAADRTRDAIRTWKRSLELRPDDTIQKLLEKAEREANAEANYSQRESSHFTLRYEGQKTSESLRRELVAILETHYDDLARTLGVTPRGSIAVVLYTDQAFFDVTQAPSWSGAINDGKLRIPVQGVNSITPELARVLKHELAHSFINQVSGGRCPQWLHEGVAQLVEPKSVSSNGRRLAELFRAQREIPFNALESSFMRFSPVEAVLAYDESLAAVEYINDTYGMSDVTRILERLAQGSSTEAALRSIIHADYGQLALEVGKYLAERYGE